MEHHPEVSILVWRLVLTLARMSRRYKMICKQMISCKKNNIKMKKTKMMNNNNYWILMRIKNYWISLCRSTTLRSPAVFSLKSSQRALCQTEILKPTKRNRLSLTINMFLATRFQNQQCIQSMKSMSNNQTTNCLSCNSPVLAAVGLSSSLFRSWPSQFFAASTSTTKLLRSITTTSFG